MTKGLFRSRLGILCLAAWLVAASAVIFDRPDPEARFYRLEKSAYLTRTLQYMGCSQMGPPRLDLAETLDYHYLSTMATINGWIADLRGEPNIDFDWLKRESARRREPVRAGDGEVEAMGPKFQR